MRRRSPLQTLIITAAVVTGLAFVTHTLAQSRGAQADARARRGRPDVTLVDATPEQLATAGYRLSEKSPKTWRDISVRLFEDDHGVVNFLRCRIAADEAQGLVVFPADARRSGDDRPPADWPRGAEGDPFRVPAWWQPVGNISRFAESFAPGSPARGIYANYDAATGWYHCWTWSRRDVTILRPDPLTGLVSDELASGLADLALRSGWPSDADGWLRKEGLGLLECGPLAKRLPASVERVDARLLPLGGQHRYFFRVVGLDAATARQIIGEVPVRDLVADGAAPAERWQAAVPPGGMPPWFAPGAGPRWAYCLVRVGDGAVERGRWAAYVVAERALYVWDWDGPAALPAAADVSVQ